MRARSAIRFGGVAVVIAAVLAPCRPSPAGDPDIPPFVRPDDAQRRAAAGDISSLSPVWRELLEPHPHDFEPIAEPAGQDWLKVRQEPGESVAQFLVKTRHLPTAGRRTIVLVPLVGGPNEPAPPDLAPLAAFLQACFQLPVREETSIAHTKFRAPTRVGPRGQHQVDADAVVSALAWRVPADAFAMIAVTATDLYPAEDRKFVFGLSLVRQRVAVISTARLAAGADDTLALGRACKLMAHEVGHLAGLSHCIYYRCLMNGSNHLDESDRRPLHFCPVCLRKAGIALRFRPVARYRSLAEFCRERSLHDDADWFERRIRRAQAAPDNRR